MAELVPNCSHVLHFSDEEVESLQKVLLLRGEPLYEAFFNPKIDPNTLKKYPPHNLKQSVQGFASYKIQNKENILNCILIFTNLLDDFTHFSYFHFYFVYIILVMSFEKLEIPPYSHVTYKFYSTVVLALHNILRCWYERFPNPKTFSKFRQNITLTDPGSDATNSIFEAINYTNAKSIQQKNCSIQ